LAGLAQTPADNDESVALGLARTGRVVTAAALVMSISLVALTAANVSIMRMFGVGLTLAVLMDATLVRMCWYRLTCMLGRANWWAPRPLIWLRDRFAIGKTVSHSGNGPRHRFRRRLDRREASRGPASQCYAR
jgi:RND superfamily putative drug exporter